MTRAVRDPTFNPRERVPEALRVLVVGELNPYGSDPEMALYHLPRNASGNRLREIMGLSDADYVKHLRKVNLCAGKWSAKAARAAAWDLLATCTESVLVLLGAKVRAMFDGPSFEVAEGVASVVYVSLPHPSGRCRAWHDPSAVDRARAVLRFAAPWVPWGSWPGECNCEHCIAPTSRLVNHVRARFCSDACQRCESAAAAPNVACSNLCGKRGRL